MTATTTRSNRRLVGRAPGRAPAALVAMLLLVVSGCAAPTSTGSPAERGPSTDPTGDMVRASPTPQSVVPTASPPSPAAGTGIRVVMTGDVLLHDGLWQVAAHDARKAGLPPGTFEFAPMFRPVRRLVSRADLAICHLETPLAPRHGPFRGYPTFSVPPHVARGLKQTGFDMCTTASNHSVDQGQDGVRRTLAALDRAGLAHAGTARSRAEARKVTTLDVKGLQVAVLSYTYGTNGIPVDPDAAWSVNLLDPERIRRDARRAKRSGADAVLVALHWGSEYQHSPSPYQLRVAREVTRSPDVDLVYGHHAHVVQPVRRINGTWVAFGLGNFVAQQDPAVPGVYEGMAVQFDILARGSGQVVVRYAGYRPTYITRYSSADPAMRVLDVDRALAGGRHPATLRRELAAARQRLIAVAGPPGR